MKLGITSTDNQSINPHTFKATETITRCRVIAGSYLAHHFI